MWYFSWILGLGKADGFGILNCLWHEFRLFDEGDTGLSTPDTAEEADASQ
ncbi:MAG: cytochrome bd-I oxidase subunit CydX [Brevundimonas sp.]